MYSDPEEAAAEAAKLKKLTDPTAAARSTIRRSRAVRLPRASAPATTTTSNGASGASRRQPSTASAAQRSLLQLARRHVEASGSTASGSSPPPTTTTTTSSPSPLDRLMDRIMVGVDQALTAGRLGEGSSSASSSQSSAHMVDQMLADADRALTEASNRRRLRAGRALLRDAMSYERSHRWTTDVDDDRFGHPAGPLPPPPPAPESWDYMGRPLRPNVDSSSPAPLDPSPPYTPAVEAGRPVRPDLGPIPPVLPSYSSRFAPAHPFERSALERIRPQREQATYRFRPWASTLTPWSATPDPGSGRADHPPPDYHTATRRRAPLASHLGPESSRSPAWSDDHQDALDGLGDRNRSLSPEATWETLLTTITPDHHLPSADSSFTSATASASAASMPSRVPISRPLPITTPNEDDLGRVCDPVDSDDDDSLAETEVGETWMTPPHMARVQPRQNRAPVAERAPPAVHASLAARSGRQPIRSGPYSQQPQPSPQQHPGQTRTVRDESFDHADRAEQLRRHREVLTALVRGDVLPEEWWAAVVGSLGPALDTSNVP